MGPTGIISRHLLWLISSAVVIAGCGEDDRSTQLTVTPGLERIFAPVKVATPPENAFHGLVRLPDGELRHYGYRGPQSQPDEYYYIWSRDNGLNWDTAGTVVTGEYTTGESRPPATRNPNTGTWIRVVSGRDGTFAMRSEDGIDGRYETVKISDERLGMIRQPVFLARRQRILVTGHQSWEADGKATFQSCVLYSDDDGGSWNLSRVPIGPRHVGDWPHQKTRWENNALEPAVTELGDGTLWMLLRTAQDNLYESFSQDGGENWSEPRQSRFYSTLTMPAFLRMSDNRLLLFWCNTTPLPEVDRSGDMSIRPEQRTGLWEDVFTNRDAIHAAVSEDDGKTWRGFRELYLNPLRNESDIATSGGNIVSLDKSVHQPQALELPAGKVMVAFGQHPAVRSIVIFDPDWLYETARADSFHNGLRDWSTFKYVEGIKGHCAYNRDPGPPLVEHLGMPGRQALHIRRPLNPELVCDLDGAVWNFPAGYTGDLTVRLRVAPGGQGGRISLIDRWINPTDSLACRYAMYALEFDGAGKVDGLPLLIPGKWHALKFEWQDCQAGGCSLKVDGKVAGELPLNRPSVNGISYVHFQSAATSEDTAGFLVESVTARLGRASDSIRPAKN